mmetsp:Transcript_65354/g.200082  ORF Transcript_65354/g.200082 Transcript_65354/m.200082 type:complete len:270 (-) Transcript_65354:1014-1823(-)
MTMVGHARAGFVCSHCNSTCHKGPQNFALICSTIRLKIVAMEWRFLIVSLFTTCVTHGYMVHVAVLNNWYTRVESFCGVNKRTSWVSGVILSRNTCTSSFLWSVQMIRFGSANFMLNATCAMSRVDRSQMSRTATSDSGQIRSQSSMRVGHCKPSFIHLWKLPSSAVNFFVPAPPNETSIGSNVRASTSTGAVSRESCHSCRSRAVAACSLVVMRAARLAISVSRSWGLAFACFMASLNMVLPFFISSLKPVSAQNSGIRNTLSDALSG